MVSFSSSTRDKKGEKANCSVWVSSLKRGALQREAKRVLRPRDKVVSLVMPHTHTLTSCLRLGFIVVLEHDRKASTSALTEIYTHTPTHAPTHTSSLSLSPKLVMVPTSQSKNQSVAEKTQADRQHMTNISTQAIPA